MSKTLLPSGCYDILPPHARQESWLSWCLLKIFENFGYEQVSPPTLEFSDNLLSGRGAALSSQVFRVMDPTAHKVMGLRADITLQVSRIASSRLANQRRPLRLSYNGLIFRMQPESIKKDRQLRQTGIELIGASGPEADAEVILVAAHAMKAAGIETISIDLNYPAIISTLLLEDALAPEAIVKILDAVRHKDIAALSGFAIRERDTLIALIQRSGNAETNLPMLSKLALPVKAKQQLEELSQVYSMLSAVREPGWEITVDITESRGLDYHSGISFSIFVPGAECEVGRGGRYRTEGASSEEATGFTLYVETLRGLLQAPEPVKRILVAEGLNARDIKTLHDQGFVTIMALKDYGSSKEEAVQMGCSYRYINGKVESI